MKNFLVRLYPPGRVRKQLLIMRMLLLFSLIFALQVSAVGNEQQTKLTLSKQSTSLSEIIGLIQDETDYSFLFANDEIMAVDNISVEVKDADIHVIMGECLKNTDLIFEVEDNVVIIRKKMPEKTVPPAKQTQQKAVKGIVYDDNNVALPGATVLLKSERARGTVTGLDGRFELVISEKSILRITFIGMQEQEIEVEPGKEYKVFMKPEIGELAQVVVTGLYNHDKKTYTGSATVVKGEDLRSMGSRSLLESLEAFDPGVIIAEDEEMGSNPNVLPNIEIRGSGTLPELQKGAWDGNPNLPTFILDGFEVSLERIYDLDLNRVESVSILKDASATAIYGSRAANGVIVVETIKPKPGELKANYSYALRMSSPDLSDYDLLNAKEKLELEKVAGVYDVAAVNFNSVIRSRQLYNERLKDIHRGADTYWLSKPVQTSWDHSHSIFIEGGDSFMKYGLSGRYQTNKGVMIGSGRDRYGLELCLIYRRKKFKFNEQLSVGKVIGKESPYGVYSLYSKANPYYLIYDEAGYLKQWLFKPDEVGSLLQKVENPLYDASLNHLDKSENINITNNFSLEWQVNEDFRVNGRVSFSINKKESHKFVSPLHSSFYNSEVKGSYTLSHGDSRSFSSNLVAVYSKSLGKHLLYFRGGGSVRESNSYGDNYRGIGFQNDRLVDINFAQKFPEKGKPTGYEFTSRDFGVFANFNYSFDNRYLFDISARRDGSSQFGSQTPWADFWSIGTAWNIHKEKFMNDALFSQFKLRGTVGTVGSQSFDPYQAQTIYQYTNNVYMSGIGVHMMGLGNDNLHWQKGLKYNLGANIAMFNDRLILRCDLFLEETRDMLLDVTTPPSVGFRTYKDNLGTMENRGVEGSITFVPIKNKEKRIHWRLGCNFRHMVNEIKKVSNSVRAYNDKIIEDQLAEGNDEEKKEDSVKPIIKLQEGGSTYDIYAVPSLGIDPSTGMEVFVKRDGNHTYKWDPKDQVVVGSKLPDLAGYLNSSFVWNRFSLRAMFRYRLGGQYFNQTLIDRVENVNIHQNADQRVLDKRWQKPGDQTFFVRVQDRGKTRPSSRFVQDYNYIEMTSLNISYDFKREFVKRLKMDRLQLSIQTRDLFRVSSVKAERGLLYPFARSLSFSLKANL